jgi:hypothetical protein
MAEKEKLQPRKPGPGASQPPAAANYFATTPAPGYDDTVMPTAQIRQMRTKLLSLMDYARLLGMRRVPNWVEIEMTDYLIHDLGDQIQAAKDKFKLKRQKPALGAG